MNVDGLAFYSVSFIHLSSPDEAVSAFDVYLNLTVNPNLAFRLDLLRTNLTVSNWTVDSSTVTLFFREIAVDQSGESVVVPAQLGRSARQGTLLNASVVGSYASASLPDGAVYDVLKFNVSAVDFESVCVSSLEADVILKDSQSEKINDGPAGGDVEIEVVLNVKDLGEHPLRIRVQSWETSGSLLLTFSNAQRLVPFVSPVDAFSASTDLLDVTASAVDSSALELSVPAVRIEAALNDDEKCSNDYKGYLNVTTDYNTKTAVVRAAI